MLSSTTCVGLRYGRHVSEVSAAFPGGPYGGLSAQPEGIAVLSPCGFNAVFRNSAPLSQPRPRFTIQAGTGILTRFPSASPHGLSLGPD